MSLAAGAIVWREITPLDLQVLIIHRPKYDDWSFPKGGVEQGENPITAAHREVIEETGISAVFGQYLDESSYEVDGEKKIVHYWIARAIDSEQEFSPNDEVDQILWLSVDEARATLSRKEDQRLLSEFAKRDRHTQALILLRHGKAIKREEWRDYDIDRPLAALGVRQAELMEKHLAPFYIQGVFSSDAIRCYATVADFAKGRSLKLIASPDFNEESFITNPKLAVEFVKALLFFSGNQLVCGHNPILPAVVKKIADMKDLGEELEPADAWIIHHRAEQVISVALYKQPKT